MAEQQRYRPIELIAAGGMAEVYRAERVGPDGFKKKVAIKRVLPHLAGKKRFIKMFLDEARVSAYLSHSNCVQVFDTGVGDNASFIVMEYVDGADLKAVVEWYKRAGKVVPVEVAVHVTLKICEGLAYAHALHDEHGRHLNIVHRDLSPPNILLTKFGEVKIVDFGLAKANTQLEKSDPGIIKGKFSYLSPEAALGQEVDARTDVFAAAIILWEMLAGKKLFQGETDYETVKQVQKAEIPSLTRINGAVDAKLEQIVLRGLARDPAARYQTAEEMARALNDYAFDRRLAVSPFDIATTVQAVVRDKLREKKQQEGPTVIDKLIEQALFEFTSLEGSAASGSRASPLGNQRLDASGGGMVDIQDWGSELGDLSGAFDKKAPSLGVEAGNLASLEDDHRPASASDEPAPAAKSSASAAGAPTPVVASPERKGGTGAVALVVVAIALVGVAAAYFGGLFR